MASSVKRMLDAPSPGSADGEDDAEAHFNRIYEAHHRHVYAYLMGRLSHAETAADLLQDVFLRVWRNLPEIRNAAPAHQRNTIFTAARSAMADYQRARLSQKRTQPGDFSSTRSERDPAEQFELREQLFELDAAIAELDEDLRLPLLMFVMGGMSSSEIAEALDEASGTVRMRIHKARRTLSQRLKLEAPQSFQHRATQHERTDS